MSLRTKINQRLNKDKKRTTSAFKSALSSRANVAKEAMAAAQKSSSPKKADKPVAKKVVQQKKPAAQQAPTTAAAPKTSSVSQPVSTAASAKDVREVQTGVRGGKFVMGTAGTKHYVK